MMMSRICLREVRHFLMSQNEITFPRVRTNCYKHLESEGRPGKVCINCSFVENSTQCFVTLFGDACEVRFNL